MYTLDFNVLIDSAGGEKDSIAYVKIGNAPQMVLDEKHGWILAAACSGTAKMMTHKEACKEAASFIRKALVAEEHHDGDPRYTRAAGDCVCEICQKPYWTHKKAEEIAGWQGRPWLTRLCNGKLVKL